MGCELEIGIARTKIEIKEKPTGRALLALCFSFLALGLALGSSLERMTTLGPPMPPSGPAPVRAHAAGDEVTERARGASRGMTADPAGRIAATDERTPVDPGTDAAGVPGRMRGNTDEAPRIEASGSAIEPWASADGAAAVRARPTSDRAEIERIIRAAALEFGVDAEALVRVAVCESQLDPLAIGPADELGVLQFRPRTFGANARRLSYTLVDIFDVRAQARVAAAMWSRGQQWQWACAK